jgi:hypothetical protein
MERSMMRELATRSVSTVATDQVGVSASDRISPVASAPVPSGPAIFLSGTRGSGETDRPLLFLCKNR